MMESNESGEPWGVFAPRGLNRLLNASVAMGLARGPIKRWISRLWRDRQMQLPIDIEHHRIRFRVHPWDNNIESKILFASRMRDRAEIMQIQQAVHDGGTFIDIGANIGYYALMAARAGARRVLAIDPNPYVQARLQFNIRANEFARCITALPIALGEEEGESTLFIPTGNMGHGGIVTQGLSGESINVPVRPLEQVLQDQQVDRVDAMKIDVEGYEDAVLVPFFQKADRQHWPTLMVIEYIHQHQWRSDPLKLMTDLGYEELCRSRSNAVLRLADNCRELAQ